MHYSYFFFFIFLKGMNFDFIALQVAGLCLECVAISNSVPGYSDETAKKQK